MPGDLAKRVASPRAMSRVRAPRQDPTRSAGLRRGLEILGLFSDAKPEWGITEVARELGVLKSQIHRAIKTLEDMRYLRRDPSTRRYCLGFKAFEIGTCAGRQTNRMIWAARIDPGSYPIRIALARRLPCASARSHIAAVRSMAAEWPAVQGVARRCGRG